MGDPRPYEELCNEVMQLMVTIGILGCVVEMQPEHVQEGYEAKIDQLRANVRNETAEFTLFGEAFDPQ